MRPIRFTVGVLGIVVFFYGLIDKADALMMVLSYGPPSRLPLFGLVVLICAPLGWGWFMWFLLWHRSPLTPWEAGIVLAVGLLFAAVTLGLFRPSPWEVPIAAVWLSGVGSLNGLGLVWIRRRVRRIRQDFNREDTAD